MILLVVQTKLSDRFLWVKIGGVINSWLTWISPTNKNMHALVHQTFDYPGLLLSTWTWPGFRCCCIICLGVWNQYRIWGSRRVTRSMGLCDTYNLLLGVFRLLRHVLDSTIYHRGFGTYTKHRNAEVKKGKNLISISPLWLCCTATIIFGGV